MASALPFASRVDASAWLAASSPQLDKLQDHIQVLPTLFRVLAACFFLPVLALALADVIGWVFFKLILRPLGYASTIRFKDPEPPAFISSLTGHDSSPPSSSSASSEASNSPISSPASTTVSLPAVEELDAAATATGQSAPRKPSRSSSKQSRTRRASQSSASDSSDVVNSSRTSSKLMNRHRAPSIGLDGPLFGCETTDGEGQTPSGESDAGTDYFAGHTGSSAAASASASSTALPPSSSSTTSTPRPGPPPVGPRRSSTLKPSLSFTKAKAE